MPNKIFGPKVVSKRIYVKKMLGPNKFESNKILGQTIFWSKKLGCPKIQIMSSWQLESVHKGPRNLHLKFGQNRISNSWDISEMNKCHQDKFCLGKCHCYSRNLLKMVPGTYLQSLVEIGSVTAEIQDWWHTPNAERRNTSNYYIDYISRKEHVQVLSQFSIISGLSVFFHHGIVSFYFLFDFTFSFQFNFILLYFKTQRTLSMLNYFRSTMF